VVQEEEGSPKTVGVVAAVEAGAAVV